MRTASSTTRFVLACIVICVVASVLGLAARRIYVTMHPAPSPASLALCFATSTDPNFATTCLTSTVDSLMDTYTPRELMGYLVGSTTPSVLVNDCHPIGHIVGAAAYTKYGSIEGALAQCSNDCRSACTHGVIGAGVLSQMGEEFADDDIEHADKAKFDQLASWYCKQNSSICHGIGHLSYLIYQTDLGALTECDAAAPAGWNRESCYQGVFMERAGDFQSELFPTSADRSPAQPQGDYLYPCSSLPETYRHSCFLFLNQYQEPLFAQDGFTTPKQKLAKATQVCATLSGTDRDDCFEGIGTSNGEFGYGLHSSGIQSFCADLPEETDKDSCTVGVVSEFLYTNLNGVYSYCENINKDEDRRAICYDAAFEWTEAILGVQNDPTRVCGTDQACIARYGVFTQHRSAIPNYVVGDFGTWSIE